VNEGTPASGADEWRRHGLVPIAAAVGYSTTTLATYALGPFVGPLEREFGWSRAEIMIGLTIMNIAGVLFNVLIGLLADRVGSRRVGLVGTVVNTGAIALLATTNGNVLTWSLLWILVAIGAALVQANVWVSGVAKRFDKSRGLAIAIALSGGSLCGAVAPLLATVLISHYGWRTALVGTAAVWLVAVWPFVFLFYPAERNEPHRPQLRAPPASSGGVSLKDGLRMGSFWRLAAACFAFAFYTLAITPNLVPLLVEKGATVMAAAQIASLVGVAGIIARISTGFLLDRLPANLLGTLVFLMPVGGCAALLMMEPSYLVLALIVVSFGATIGAEYDVVMYLTARHFGLIRFAAIMGALLTAGSLGAAIAPVTAGWMHDRFGGYEQLLALLMVLMGLAAVAIGTLGRPSVPRATTIEVDAISR
jgi:MFS family permease